MAGAEEHARRIFADMREERPERLRSIREELLRVESKDFWEVIDRGTNFDYVDPQRKAQLRVFFSWFPSLASERDPVAFATTSPPNPASSSPKEPNR